VEFGGYSSKGSYRQDLVLDFGGGALMQQTVLARVALSTDDQKKMAALASLLPGPETWSPRNTEVSWISKRKADDLVSLDRVTEELYREVTEHNYFQLMREWVGAEELARQKILSR
jgi:hypothetical protein